MITLPYNSDCLIYNDYGTGTSRRTVKHLLPAVWWEEQKGVNVIRSGLTTANSVEVIITQRKGYKAPQEWQQLTIDEVLSGTYYTIQESDRMIKGNPSDAPITFTSTTAVDQFFGTNFSHAVMSVDEKKLPGSAVHHYEIGCR